MCLFQIPQRQFLEIAYAVCKYLLSHLLFCMYVKTVGKSTRYPFYCLYARVKYFRIGRVILNTEHRDIVFSKYNLFYGVGRVLRFLQFKVLELRINYLVSNWWRPFPTVTQPLILVKPPAYPPLVDHGQTD